MKALASTAHTFGLLALLTAIVLPTIAGTNAWARGFLDPDDIASADTAQAVVTVSEAGNPDNIRAIRFPAVPDLQSCFTLAWNAVEQSRGESSATCINERGIIAATYFCAWGADSPECQMVRP